MVYKNNVEQENEALKNKVAELEEELADERQAALDFESKVLAYLEKNLGDRRAASEELDIIIFGSREAYEADKAQKGAYTPEERLAAALFMERDGDAHAL